ncbi:helix-hairpin-helix domain-containing protein [Flagellimonas olearia]|uniref:Helix-hairpin-helix domain-containing protein n=1 Tax=Flagellimonas olearia TaxID=552546 RepID=A0A6I1E7P6_9FLAO|nr:helix-hairpin-helix domain-containing protein [Allomuricauda olearia]KAB7529536.1 helix-hairpin-helix domain-containing protein [Allomuricauda olearia]
MIKGSHFRFNKQERSGIFFLLLIIFIFQGIYFYVKAKPFDGNPQVKVDAIMQAHLDSLKGLAQMDAGKIFPFNPNYITDHKGYALGMSLEELDRLFDYRDENKYINSAEEFQKVTQVSDSLLNQIAPYFKFPAWAKTVSVIQKKSNQNSSEIYKVGDLNQATAEELMRVNGVGPTLSKRIVKFRDRLGGFVVNEQLYDVYGLEPEVVQRTLKLFQVLQPPTIKKININQATAEELSQLVYINQDMALEIVLHRKRNGPFSSLDELVGVGEFPTDRIERIKLYLTL